MIHIEGHGDFVLHCGLHAEGRAYTLYVEAGKAPLRALGLDERARIWFGYGTPTDVGGLEPGWYAIDFQRSDTGEIVKMVLDIREADGA